MSNLKFKISNFLAAFFGFLSIAGSVSAQVCPVCVVAIGAGLGFSRWFGIDDVISSIWIGAFMVAITSWTLSFMHKKGWHFTDDGIAITLFYIAFTYIPLYYAGIVGHPLNQIFGIDKIIFGSLVGATALFLAHWAHNSLKKAHDNKSYFPYQRVAIPFFGLLITSLIFYFLI